MQFAEEIRKNLTSRKRAGSGETREPATGKEESGNQEAKKEPQEVRNVDR